MKPLLRRVCAVICLAVIVFPKCVAVGQFLQLFQYIDMFHASFGFDLI